MAETHAGLLRRRGTFPQVFPGDDHTISAAGEALLEAAEWNEHERRAIVTGENEKAKNKRGLAGWFNPYPYNLERWAYAFQRITGLGVLAYVIGHLGDTSFFVGGPVGTGPSASSWASISNLVENSFGHLILILVVLMIAFHGINGVRLILAEFGVISPRVAAIEYPYRAKSLKSAQEYIFWIALSLAVVAAMLAWWILFG